MYKTISPAGIKQQINDDSFLHICHPAAELSFRIAENERRKAYNAEQRSEFENYVEEERDGECARKLLSIVHRKISQL